MSKKTVIFEACRQCHLQGETVNLGYSASLICVVRYYVKAYNAINVRKPCLLGTDKVADCVTVSPIIVSQSVANTERGMLDCFAQMSTIPGGDMDSQIRQFFWAAMDNLYFETTEVVPKSRITAALNVLNDEEAGDVMFRASSGKLCFYRKSWLNGRDFFGAVYKFKNT